MIDNTEKWRVINTIPKTNGHNLAVRLPKEAGQLEHRNCLIIRAHDVPESSSTRPTKSFPLDRGDKLWRPRWVQSLEGLIVLSHFGQSRHLDWHIARFSHFGHRHLVKA